MATALDSLSITLSIFSRIKNVLDLSTSKDEIDYNPSWAFTDGAGALMADVVWSDQRTLTASTTEDLDLAGGLTDAFGTTITFARIKGIIIFAASANTNNVQVGGAGSTFINWVANSSDIVNIRPNGLLVLIAPDATGYAVTAGSGDLLRIGNSAGGTSVIYNIILIGSLT